MDNFQIITEKYLSQPSIIKEIPQSDLHIIVVIPCYDEDNVFLTLNSLYLCNPTCKSVEVILHVNQSEYDSLIINNIRVKEQFIQWREKHIGDDKKKFFYIENLKLPYKYAGVGLARKIGMDEALNRFAKVNNEQGIIVCLDADTICEKNYLQEIEEHYNQNPKCSGTTIYFEHYIDIPFKNKLQESIYNYELYLRYYKRGLQIANHPNAFHTVGSAITVKAKAYVAQGGMNKRKAGEDFYFTQKIIAYGNFHEIVKTKIIPSSRESNRVPFGTGKVISDIIHNNKKIKAYNPEIFDELQLFLKQIENYYKKNDIQFSRIIKEFLKTINWKEELVRIKKHSKTKETFKRHFYKWFDGFKVLKFVHYLRDNKYGTLPVIDAATIFLNKHYQINCNEKQLLEIYRKLDQNQEL